MQQPPMQFYSSTTTTTTTTASEGGATSGAQVIDAAMTSAVTSLMNGANGIHTMQQHPVSSRESALTQLHPKRKQVKNACTNCQKACKKCDDARPCPRCIKYGITETCVNSVRKERKKGIKRGPYKRRTKEEEEASGSRPHKSSKQDGSNDEKEHDDQERAASGTAAASQYEAMRPPNVPYGYPSNLNQYAQPYDAATAAAAAYGQYAAAYHNKDQMMSNPYVAIYHSMGYPVPLPAANSDHHHHHQHHHHRDNSSEHQQQDGHVKREDDDDDNDGENDGGRNEAGEGEQEDKDAADSATAPASSAIKKEAQDGKGQRSSTPVPSTSTSPATTSSPESAEDDDAAKLHHLQRLTELCTAALSQSNQSRAAE
ncbi:hypothetical protein BDB00DRAFT_875161 [Zychaea mexicana]|uniref:uncharacterized protein n=1 Tax=Zychaea mexicana TaxID=64656 RepID=UPI0022FEFAA9|nr:uncharacterized protein BDB00DRAFT_875161 [Zychaea mexicana]KAI9490563.1 hypothetical protein BDB00DRAFT_875161 [Zychaea mexicana]